jgi:hypothetical protein
MVEMPSLDVSLRIAQVNAPEATSTVLSRRNPFT